MSTPQITPRGPVDRDGGPTAVDDLPLALAPIEREAELGILGAQMALAEEGPFRDDASGEVLTQADIDAALVEAEREAARLAPEVRDIPGVNTAAHSDDLESWRAIRGKTLSATAATVVIGSSPFSTVMDLWRERMEGFEPTFSRFSLTIMNYGTLAEPELVAEANRYVDEKTDDMTPFVLTHGYVLAARDERFGCTPDGWRLLEGPDGGTLELLELKTGSKSWRKTPRSKPVVPQNYIDQVQWQLMVTDAARALVVYRQVKRDRQGNVEEVLGHEHVWVERDEKRIEALVEAVEAYLQDERDLIPPMKHIDIEDQFDDLPEVTQRKSAIREALASLRRADAILNREEVTNAAILREESLGALKNLMRETEGRQVIVSDGLLGAKLSRSTRVGYDTKKLTDAQRARIRTTTTIESLRVAPEKNGD